jgi:hypothetical protein
MKPFVIFTLLATVAFAEPKSNDDVSSGEDFLAFVRAADRVVIESPDPAEKDARAIVSQQKVLAEFLSLFRFSERPLRGERWLSMARTLGS